MTYKRFEELPVWQEAIGLAEGTFEFTERCWSGSRSLRDQLERAVISISNNIAEGFERGTTNELLAFLYIARGSAGEVRSMLCFIERRAAFSNLKSQISDLKSRSESCSRQLRAWADHLQNTDIQGQRHLNDATRHHYQARKDKIAFQQELLETLSPDHPLRKKASSTKSQE
jgi:four helix bundle protein